MTGTYQWNSSYSGDTNNNTASENSAAAERVVVSPANPTIVTTPSVTAVTLGTSLVTLNDTAVLSGGYHETGTITFTLYLGSTLVDTETVPVSGNGTYTTPTGYTLPHDGHSDRDLPVERQLQRRHKQQHGEREQRPDRTRGSEPRQPSIMTTPSVTAVTLGTSLVTLNDTAVLSGGYNEIGHDHVHAVPGQHAGGTETVSVSGNGTYTRPPATLPPRRAQ